jgi:TolA-binding protein
MKYRIVGARRLAWFLVAGIFAFFLASSTAAQTTMGPPPGAGPPPNKNPNIDDRVRQIDEGRLRSAEMDVGTEQRNQQLQAAIANMKEDFNRIQIVRNDIARNLVAHKPLDYKLVSEQTAEINKRARRLNIYMRARSPEGEKQNNAPELKSEEMIGALVKLCKLIDSFTENPALKNAATIDSKEIAKAKENKANADLDLVAIIKLSGTVQKKSENLKISQ